MHNSIIELKNINKIYGSAVKTQVLYDLNLDIKEGSFNSIIGQSGSGKSTLLNIVGTLDKPTSGEVFIDGKRTDQMKKNELADLRNRTMGFIFQFHYLLPEFTALENVLMPHRIIDTTETIYNLLRDINEKFKTTFVVITHDRRIAEKADRIIEIKDGKIGMDI